MGIMPAAVAVLFAPIAQTRAHAKNHRAVVRHMEICANFSSRHAVRTMTTQTDTPTMADRIDLDLRERYGRAVMTPADVMAELGISRRTLDLLLQRKQLARAKTTPGVKQSKTMILRRSVAEFLASGVE